MSTRTADREIVAMRVIDAPRETVFEMWTKHESLARWWGPNGFTITTHEMDSRPGGIWRFVMHGPDGNYQNKIVYDEIVPPERLVYTHTGDARFQTTVTLTERGNQTEVEVRMVFDSAAERAQVVKTFNAVEGLNQTLGRLVKHLTEMSGDRA